MSPPEATTAAPDRSPFARLREVFVGVPLCADDEAAYEVERLQHNRRIVRTLLWLVLPIHLLTVAAFWGSIGTRGEADVYRSTVMQIHLWAVPGLLSMSYLVLRVEPRFHAPRWSGWASDLYCLFYMFVAVALSTNAQRLNGNVNVFVLITLTSAILFRLRVRPLLAIAGLSTCALFLGVTSLVVEPAVRVAVLSPALAIWVIGLAAAHVQAATARRELRSRRETERGRAELAAQQEVLRGLNDELECRVASQVGEIVANAREIEALNRHLRVQIAERSAKLAHALATIDRTSPPLKCGDVLDGRVEIVERIASGGMGDVYRGVDRLLGREVAVKVPQADAAVGRELWLRFANEARAAASVTHPAVVRTLHVGVSDEGRLYQLQDLIEGTSLAQVLASNARWPAAHAARIGAVLAEGLAAAHAAGVVHRDVKPSNVMLCSASPGVQLLDFGVSKLHDDIGRATLVGSILGTPRYMAPEQIRNPDQAGAEADVYALGVMLFELVTGAPPFEGNALVMLDRHLREPAPRIETELACPRLIDLVDACMSKVPAERPDAAALGRTLCEIADAEAAPPAEALPLPAPRPMPRNVDQAETVRIALGRT